MKASAIELPKRRQNGLATASFQIEPSQATQKEVDCTWGVTIDALPQLICLLDRFGRIVQVNQTLERWRLGQVATVRGRAVHNVLHGGCTEPHCYLITYLEQMWQEVAAGRPVECETKDDLLMRHLHLQLRPISAPHRDQSASPTSYAALVIDDVTEQKQTEAALRQYARDLVIRNQELDTFAHTVAHNLKDQLTPIIGYAETLQAMSETTSLDQLEKDLEVIARNGYKMSSTIDELLLLAKVRKTEIELKPLDMAAILHEVQQRLGYVINQFQAEVIEPETWPVALGYAPWIEEVWANYISNAIKYSGYSPRIELGATLLDTVPEMVQFWIRDSGPGLNPEQQAKLFKPFTRLSLGRNKGHGLGLSIVQQIIDKLGGQVSVESEGVPGQGCTFSFTLPATAGPD